MHQTQVSRSNISNASAEVEKGEFVTKTGSGPSAKVPIPLGKMSRANIPSSKDKIADQEADDEDQSPSELHEADFKNFVLEQM